MSQLEISNIEYLVIVGYLALIVAVGLVFKKFSSNTDDYFKGGCKGTWWLVGSSAFMAAFSAWTFTGAAGIAYESGFSVFWIFFGNALGFLVNFLFMGAWFRQLRVTTFPEAICGRFGKTTRDIYAVYYVFLGILYSAMALYGLGIFCSSVFGYDINYVMIVCGIVVLFYSATGGRWGVMATDFLQGLILVPLTIIIAWLCLDALGGVGNLFQQIEAQGLSDDYSFVSPGAFFGGGFTWGWITAMMAKQFIFFNSIAGASRYFSVKDGKEASKAALLGSILMLMGSVIWFLPPITARILFPEQVMAFDITKPAEASFAVASVNLLPVGLVGLIVVAILAATMSSMDTYLNQSVAVLIKDMYPKLASHLKWKPRAEHELLSYGRILTWIMGIMVVILALYLAQQDGKGIFGIMIQVGTLLTLPATIPLVWGLFIRQTPWWGALLSIATALIVSCVAYFEIPLVYLGFSQQVSDGFEWNFQQQFFAVFGAGTFGFLMSMFFAPARDSEHRQMVDKFLKNMKTPINFEKEIGEGNDLSQLISIGRFGAAVSAFIAFLLIIPNPLEGRIAILVLALLIGGVSALMLKAGMKSNISGTAEEKQTV